MFRLEQLVERCGDDGLLEMKGAGAQHGARMKIRELPLATDRENREVPFPRFD